MFNKMNHYFILHFSLFFLILTFQACGSPTHVVRSDVSEAKPFTCVEGTTPEQSLSKSYSKALSREQYLNTQKYVWSVLTDNSEKMLNDILVTVIFPQDIITKYPRNSSHLNLIMANVYLEIADKISNQVTTASLAVVTKKALDISPGTCTNRNPFTLDTNCKQQLVRNLGSLFYRRKLIEKPELNEVSVLLDEIQATTDIKVGINNLIFRLMLSHNFLNIIEDNESLSPNDKNILHLSSAAIANRLSYTLWNSMPDLHLLNLANTSNLFDDASFEVALNYVLADKKFETSLKEFANGWLHLYNVPEFDPLSVPIKTFSMGIQYDNSMRSAMIAELQDFVVYTVRNGGKIEDLLTSAVYTSNHEELAKVYGITERSPSSISMTHPFNLGSTRAGILTRAGLLADASARQHLIHRAVFLKKDILCIPTKPAPADVTPPVPLTEEEIMSFTTRKKYAHNTSSKTCAGCHSSINPFGFALSQYNGLGIYSLTEPTFKSSGEATGKQVPIDSTSDLSEVFSGGPFVKDAVEHSAYIAKRKELKSCFVENYAEYFLSRTIEKSGDGCNLNDMYVSSLQSKSILDLIKNLAQNKQFRMRKLED